MITELRQTLTKTEKEAQYDAAAKCLLGEKIILAHILIRTIDEFKGMTADEVVLLIEGEPYIGQVPVEPGATNQKIEYGSTRITGMDTENAEMNEGTTLFDIIFYVRMKNGRSKIIINVEAQRKEPDKYWIINRAIFYVGRMISSQKEREFTGMNYDDIEPVYSIWICMNMQENSMCHIHLVQDDLIDAKQWKGDLDIPNIIMIGLSKEIPEQDEKYELHRLLGTLLSEKLSAEEKLQRVSMEYDIPVKGNNVEKEVSIMCNLSQGIKEESEAKGEEKARTEIVLNMHKKGYSLDQIVEITNLDVSTVKAIIG